MELVCFIAIAVQVSCCEVFKTVVFHLSFFVYFVGVLLGKRKWLYNGKSLLNFSPTFWNLRLAFPTGHVRACILPGVFL